MMHSELPEHDVIAKSTPQVDILMMVITPGGKERTAKEFQMLGKEAGFASSKYICGPDIFGVVELYKM